VVRASEPLPGLIKDILHWAQSARAHSLASLSLFSSPHASCPPQEATTLRSEQRSLQSALSEAQAEARALAAELAQFKQLAG